MADRLLRDWTSRHQEDLYRMQCSVKMAESTGNEFSVAVEVGSDTKVTVMMPAAVIIGLELREDLEGVLIDLNEKFQDMSPAPSLDVVLDALLRDFVCLTCKPDEEEQLLSDADSDSEGEVRFSTLPTSLYGLAAAADEECKSWNCRVKGVIDLVVTLQLRFPKAAIARAFGLHPERPLDIILRFGSGSWEINTFRAKDFYPSNVEVTQIGISKADKTTYPLSTMLPNLVMIFCEFYSRRSKGDWTNYIMLGRLEAAAEKQSNPLLGLLQFIVDCLESLWETCPICLRLLPASTLKLQACSRDLCQFKFQEMGLGTSCVLEMIHSSPEVLELEVALMSFAAASRTRDVLEPFPSFLLKERELRERNGWFGGKKANTSMDNKMISLASKLLAAIPSVEAMVSSCRSESDLQELLRVDPAKLSLRDEETKLVEPDKLPLKMLRFCVSSNRLSLRFLAGDERLPIQCLAQFAVVYDSPEQEAFLELKSRDCSSFFAFHGSGSFNWYSILRNGVRSMSHTTYMSAGAVSGAGIYAAKAMLTSLGYCTALQGERMPNGYGRFGDQTICLGIIEVMAQVKSLATGVYVIPPQHEDYVAVRYLLLFKPDKLHSYYGGGGQQQQHGIEKRVLDGKVDLFEHHRQLR